jgi:hypothetical protein
MKTLLITLLALLTAAVTCHAASGPIIVGTGAGESEYSVIFARAKLAEILTDCLQISCALTATQSAGFANLVQLAQTPPTVQFKSGALLLNRLYEIHGTEVWFNQDRLWLDSIQTKPFDVAEAAALWIDVLAPNGDKAALNLLKTKLRESLRQNLSRVRAALNDGLTFELLHWRPAQGQDRLYARDPALQTVELSQALIAHLGCSEGLKSLKIFSPTWVSMTQTAQAEYLFNLGLGVKWTCGSITKSESGYILISAKGTRLDPGTISILFGGVK